MRFIYKHINYRRTGLFLLFILGASVCTVMAAALLNIPTGGFWGGVAVGIVLGIVGTILLGGSILEH